MKRVVLAELFFFLFCGAPDQMRDLFLGPIISPPSQLQIRSCSSIEAKRNVLESFPQISFYSSKFHPPLLQATPPFCALSLSLSFFLWCSLVPSPWAWPLLTFVRKLKRVRTSARSLKRRGLGLDVLICEFVCFFMHMLYFINCRGWAAASPCFRNESPQRREGMSVMPGPVCVCVGFPAFLQNKRGGVVSSLVHRGHWGGWLERT